MLVCFASVTFAANRICLILTGATCRFAPEHVTKKSGNKRSLPHKIMHLLILDQESDSDEDPNFMMGYPSPFMSYYYKGEAGKIRLEAERDRLRKQAEALQQEGGTGVVRREDAPSKGEVSMDPNGLLFVRL